jgi:pimeloyl-ACP methyl ester carboxylesterase
MTGWAPDALLAGFEATQLELPDDYEGAVRATLVRRNQMPRARRVVLYVHGFIDYFFQAHMAERFIAEGWRFYALDLRKHGRSMSAHQRPNFCKSLEEYFADITRAIDLILRSQPCFFDQPSGKGLGQDLAAFLGRQAALKQRANSDKLHSARLPVRQPVRALRDLRRQADPDK